MAISDKVVLATVISASVCMNICLCKLCSYNKEIENGLSSMTLRECGIGQYPCTMTRDAASNGHTVLLKSEGQYVFFDTTLFVQCVLQVTNVIYSNAGPQDKIKIYLDDIEIGDFNTVASSPESGTLLNVFRSSNQVGETGELLPADYKITIVANLTEGVELDKMSFSFDCEGERCPVVSPQPDQDKSSQGGLSNIAISLLVILNLALVILIILVVIMAISCCKGRKISQLFSFKKITDTYLNKRQPPKERIEEEQPLKERTEEQPLKERTEEQPPKEKTEEQPLKERTEETNCLIATSDSMDGSCN